MANKDFVIGDRVTLKPGHCWSGETGTVVQLMNEFEGRFVGVEFDRIDQVRHDCGGLAKEHHGWYVDKEDLILQREPREKLCPPDLSLLTTL